ncbi:MAG: hypothetical protein HOK35_02835 [Cytophagia bacterium]|nr:hypothetical protein [Cytophagia bacterium]
MRKNFWSGGYADSLKKMKTEWAKNTMPAHSTKPTSITYLNPNVECLADGSTNFLAYTPATEIAN